MSAFSPSQPTIFNPTRPVFTRDRSLQRCITEPGEEDMIAALGKGTPSSAPTDGTHTYSGWVREARTIRVSGADLRSFRASKAAKFNEDQSNILKTMHFEGDRTYSLEVPASVENHVDAIAQPQGNNTSMTDLGDTRDSTVWTGRWRCKLILTIPTTHEMLPQEPPAFYKLKVLRQDGQPIVENPKARQNTDELYRVFKHTHGIGGTGNSHYLTFQRSPGQTCFAAQAKCTVDYLNYGYPPLEGDVMMYLDISQEGTYS
ncbi:uncharacterized protein I303_108504 [Kwoniella dejecticola CBS 10117]|uniref:Uncharacterized protein n=1 Tax=Kwoniella dejecticola CBS 10117 TaxID=1296121 RepID=A0A1A5ZX78_9TREE|nr:uncharacterized protein I303_07172 [Kwoniella dejecticola CBS 10117]OBR82413.1 hypothetical protein I303_07172 [Kwoniella dejecticola CBS 10117]